jgi:hypothetical protein
VIDLLKKMLNSDEAQQQIAVRTAIHVAKIESGAQVLADACENDQPRTSLDRTVECAVEIIDHRWTQRIPDLRPVERYASTRVLHRQVDL